MEIAMGGGWYRRGPPWTGAVVDEDCHSRDWYSTGSIQAKTNGAVKESHLYLIFCLVNHPCLLPNGS